MVESGGLENRCTARYRGFESYLLRILKISLILIWLAVNVGSLVPFPPSDSAIPLFS